MELRRVSVRLGLVSLVVSLGSCGDAEWDQEQLEQAIVVCARGPTIQGLDVSSWQGSINWNAVHGAGKQFAIIRVSDGTYLDPYFARNWSGARASGIIRGAYQFFHPGRDPVVQADFMVSHMGALDPTDLPPMLDLEATDGATPAHIVQSVRAWIDRIEARTGRHPIIYTGKYFWNDNVRSSGFTSYPLVIAQYGPRCPDLPNPWTQWFMWQYSSSGSVAGISGRIDTDVYNGTIDDLRRAITASALHPAPVYGARYVAQSWPLAAVGPLRMTAGEHVASYIELRNSGTATWTTATRLATTVARDRASIFADTDWVSPNRLDQVTGTVAPGASFRFRFSFHAPAMPGTYTEHFGLVQEGVTWFSAAGQGGPADNVIEAQIVVTAGPTDAGSPDATVRDAATADASLGDVPSNDVGARDASTSDASTGDVGASDGDLSDGDDGDGDTAEDVPEPDDATTVDDSGVAHAGDPPTEAPSADDGGCGCAIPGRSHGAPDALALVALGLSVTRRRRREPRA